VGARRIGFSGAAEIIAHRGYSARAPENTLVAVETAIAAGADAVEFDLHVTADGTPVLFHDETLGRTTDGEGALRDRTLAELRRLDAGSWFAPAFAGEAIPTFAEALGRLRERIGRVYPEVKGYRGPEDLSDMVDLVLEHGLVDRTVFISMDWSALERIRARRSDLGVGYIVEKASRARDALARAAGDAHALVDFKGALLLEDPSLAEEAGRRGVELAVWTVDDPADAARLLALGVPRITTNRVAELTAWKATL
jgi:glycerophosphoryl diester phosphodiesterase